MFSYVGVLVGSQSAALGKCAVPVVFGYWMWDPTALSFISCIIEAHTVNSQLFRSVKATAGFKKTTESADSCL